jgi:hypothetical protein
MTQTIYRYPVKLVDEQVISMPAGATILAVARREGSQTVAPGPLATSHEAVELWAAVDPAAPLEERRLRVAGTGHPLPDRDGLRHLGTVQIAGGKLVFHVFEDCGEQPNRDT